MKPWSKAASWAEEHAVGLLLFVGAALRLFRIGSVPGGLNQDEASTGYDAWALLHAGVDRNGFSWPVQFLSWGSGQNALFAWLSLPFLAVGGLSVTALRLTMATLGVATLVVFWRLAVLAGGRGMGLAALFVLALNPWHIMASRWGLESNVLPLVVLVAVLAMIESTVAVGRRKPLLFLLGSATLGASVYAYGTAYLFSPLFLVAALLVLQRHAGMEWRLLFFGALTTAIVASPMLVFVLNNRVGTGSLSLGPISWPHYPGPARFDSIFLPFSPGGRARLPGNALTVLRLLLESRDDGLAWNAIPGFGPLLPISLPFLVLGLGGAARKPRRAADVLMIAWLALALLVGLMTDANINRINLVWLPAIWFIARGLVELAVMPKLLRGAALVFVLASGAFVVTYFGRWNDKLSEAFAAGFGPALRASIARAGEKDGIVVTGHVNMPYISTLFFSETPVREYLDTVVIPNRTAAFQTPTSFGRFVFGVSPEALVRDRYFVVHKSEKHLFDPALYGSESFGSFASVWKK